MRKLFFSILAVLLLIAAVAAPPVMAVGTPYGTVITNQASATYKDANGNAMTPVTSNAVSMTVQQIFALNIAPLTSSMSGGNLQTAYFPGRVYNLGNGADTFTISWASTGGTWTPTSVAMYADVNDNGVYDDGTDTLINPTVPGGNEYLTGSIAADAYASVIMAVGIPDNATAPDGSQNVITVTVHSNGNTSKTMDATCTTQVSAAVISAVKGSAVSVVSGTTTPKATPTFRPGDEVMWTVTMTNTGTSTAAAIRAVDNISSNLTFVPGSIEVNFNDTGWASRNDACGDGPDACYDAANRRILIPGDGSDPSPYNLPAGTNYKVRARYIINAGVPVGTVISNTASIQFTSGASTVNTNTNTSTFTVEQLALVDLTAVSTNKSGNPSDQIAYAFTATNTGNGPDRINITTNSTAAWTWQVYLDVNSNGLLDAGDTLLTDTNSDSTVDTGLLSQNQTVHLLAVATIPSNAANNSTDTLTVTGTSVFDGTKTDSVAWTTTVTAPVLALSKEIVFIDNTATDAGGTCTPANTATGSPCSIYPGSVITYRVTATNNGAGNATQVVISDAIPANTTYVASSIYTGPNASSLVLRTDASDNDGGRYDAGYVIAGSSTTSPVNLGPGATWVVQFKVSVN